MLLVGVDIGGTKCAAVLASICEDAKEPGGTIAFLGKRQFPTPCEGPEAAFVHICDSIEELTVAVAAAAGDIAAIGVSCGGPLDARKGLILGPPNLPGWDEVPIVHMLAQRFGVPVFLQNDADAGALAEWRYGAAKGCRNAVFLTFGTGNGAGLILNGQLYTGASNMAGEVGHMRLTETGPVGYGKSGSFEGWCSGGGIAQLAKMRALEQLQRGGHPAFCRTKDQLGTVTAQTVAEAATSGDALAKAIYAECAEYLGRGLAVLVDILNPEVIVLGSIYVRSEALLREGMLAALQREALPQNLEACRVLPAVLREQLGDYAAISVAIQGLQAHAMPEGG